MRSPARTFATYAAGALLACGGVAWAQQPPKDLFKGKVKPGRYEDKVEMDMSAVPGVPKGQGKESRTSQRCLTQQEIEKGFFAGEKGCESSNFRMSGDVATFTTVCKKGADTQTVEMRIASTA